MAFTISTLSPIRAATGCALQPPSSWIQRWTHLLAANSRVLDLACGSGRHSQYLAGLGHQVTAVDRDAAALANLAASTSGAVRTLEADLEGAPWPFGATEQFDAIVVTNYLHRALFPAILRSLATGGVLLYETFAQGNETVGRPASPDFLLQNGELLRLTEGLRVIAYQDGFIEQAKAAFVQRICAVKQGGEEGVPRYLLPESR